MSGAKSSSSKNSEKKANAGLKDIRKSPDDLVEAEKESTSLREHSNGAIRFFAKAGYTVWIIVMVVGLVIAFVVSLFLV